MAEREFISGGSGRSGTAGFASRAQKFIRENRWELVTVAALTAIALYLLYYYVPWRDEAQAWLIARDTSFTGLFQQLKYEGHPAVWYLILWPLAHLGLPYGVMHAVNLVFYALTVWVIVKHAPFKWPIKALVLLAMPMVQYAVEARSYMLMFLLLFLAVKDFPKRREHPIRLALWCGLLANTHVFGAGLAGGILVVSLVELARDGRKAGWKALDRARVIGAAIQLVALAALVVCLFGSIGTNEYAVPATPSGFWEAVGTISYGMQRFGLALFGRAGVTGIVLMCFLIAYFFLSAAPKPRTLWLVACCCGAPFLVICFIYASHSEMMILFLFASAWLMAEDGLKNPKKLIARTLLPLRRTVAAVLTVLLAFMAVDGLYMGLVRLNPWTMNVGERNGRQYTSMSVYAARFLNEEKYDDYIIVGHGSAYVSSIVPFLKDGKKVWYADQQEFGSYVTWNAKYNAMVDSKQNEVIRRIKTHFDEDDKILVVLDKAHYSGALSRQNLKLVYESPVDPVKQSDERYYIFEFDWDPNTIYLK